MDISYTKKDITKNEFNKKHLPFYINYDYYINEYVVPEAVVFYISNAYYRDCLGDNSFVSHINSAIDMFNTKCDLNILESQVEKIMAVKYNLRVIQLTPLKLVKYR
jgi:hypothetical protein